jgi:hypothetical protein
MKKILLIAILFVTMSSSAQLGIGTTSPAASSILDISSTEKGFLLPRMTNSQKNSIATPTAGLWIWCSDCGASGEMQVYNGTNWTTLSDDVAPSSLAYTGSPFTYTIYSAITPIASPTNSGGTPTSYSISPALPAGLALNTASGSITGTPTVVSASATYMLTATNTGGSTTATINITVNDIAPSTLAYTGSPFTYTKGTAISAIAAPTNAGGTVVSYAVSPSLPAGLSLNTATGAITGTQSVVSASATYTITATNTGGSTSTTISITVNDAAPTSLAYTGSPFTYAKDIAIATLSPVSSGGAVVSYAVSPALPAGLTLNTSTGDITGTPTVSSAATTYTITATNSFGSTTAPLNITVN